MGIATDTRWLDAHDQIALVRAGQVSPAELVSAAAERIGALPALNAVIRSYVDEALAEASAPERADTPLAGLPFFVKDLWADTAGQVTTDGNAALRDLPSQADAVDSTLIARLRAAGASFAGRTNTPEFGLMPTTEPDAFGATRNPWDPSRTPGGSSGGAAAAVAAGLVPVAHASDGGGSIRIPAACCGLVGLKPSQGRITAGPAGDEAGLGVQLVVSRTVRDTAWFLDLVRGPGVGDTIAAAPPARPYVDEVGAPAGSLRIGFSTDTPRTDVNPEVVAAVQQTAELLASLGHRVSEAAPPMLADDTYLRPFAALWSSNTGLNLRRVGAELGREATEADVEPLTWALGKRAAKYSAADLGESLAAVVACRRALRAWWAVDGWDLLLTPTLSDVPPKLGVMATNAADPIEPFRYSGRFAAFTSAFNISHQPAISLPMHWTPPLDGARHGLPVGVQLVADYGREDVLIRVASQLEAAAPWAQRTPDLAALA